MLKAQAPKEGPAMASRCDDTNGPEAVRPAGGCRVIRVDLRRRRVTSLADQVRQGSYAIDARRLASDLLRLERAFLCEAECPKP